MTLNEIEQRLDALQAEKDKLTAELERLKAEEQSKEVKPWRAGEGDKYYYIDIINKVATTAEAYLRVDFDAYSCGNYYRTRELAEQDAKELALRGRVRQLRDALCEGYQFRHAENNYCICFNQHKNEYYVVISWQRVDVGAIYFDTDEHAQTACDILNAERRKESGGNG